MHVHQQMEEIETKEQNLIQHLRTAGLRQNKETALVDEVLELRRERRRLLSSLQERNGQLEKAMLELERQNNTLQQQIQVDLDDIRQQHHTQLVQRDEQWHNLECLLREEAEHKTKTIIANEKLRYDAIKRSYEQKLVLLESKLREITHEKESKELQQAKSIASTIVSKVTAEIESKYQRKLSE
jgi:hypothetical protein